MAPAGLSQLRPDLRREPHGEVVRLAAQGDQSAWAELIDRFGASVIHAARRAGLDGNDAADVAQATWLRLLEHIHDLRKPEQVHAWLVTTTRREAWRVVAAGRRQVPSVRLFETEPPAGADADPGQGIDQDNAHDALEAAMGRLTSKNRQLLGLLIDQADLSYVEVAERVGISVGSVGPTRQRCLAKLRSAPELAAIR